MRLLCRSCHVTLCHVCELWSLVYSCAMRIMPHQHAMNTNDVMCASHDMHAPVSQPSLSIHDVPEITY